VLYRPQMNAENADRFRRLDSSMRTEVPK